MDQGFSQTRIDGPIINEADQRRIMSDINDALFGVNGYFSSSRFDTVYEGETPSVDKEDTVEKLIEELDKNIPPITPNEGEGIKKRKARTRRKTKKPKYKKGSRKRIILSGIGGKKLKESHSLIFH